MSVLFTQDDSPSGLGIRFALISLASAVPSSRLHLLFGHISHKLVQMTYYRQEHCLGDPTVVNRFPQQASRKFSISMQRFMTICLWIETTLYRHLAWANVHEGGLFPLLQPIRLDKNSPPATPIYFSRGGEAVFVLLCFFHFLLEGCFHHDHRSRGPQSL